MTKFSDLQPLYAGYRIVTFPVTEEKRGALRATEVGPKAQRGRDIENGGRACDRLCNRSTQSDSMLDVDTDSEMVLRTPLTGTDTPLWLFAPAAASFMLTTITTGTPPDWPGKAYLSICSAPAVTSLRHRPKVARGEYHFIKGCLTIFHAAGATESGNRRGFSRVKTGAAATETSRSNRRSTQHRTMALLHESRALRR